MLIKYISQYNSFRFCIIKIMYLELLIYEISLNYKFTRLSSNLRKNIRT